MTTQLATPYRADTARILRALADAMDADNARTGHAGIPPSMGHHLIHRAVTGPHETWAKEWADRARTDGLPAAQRWSATQHALVDEVTALVYPGGADAETVTAEHVRQLADANAREEKTS